MRKRFSLAKLPRFGRDRRLVIRVIVGVLLAANLAAAVLIVRPWGGSAEELELQLAGLHAQSQQRQAAIARLKLLVGKSDKARQEGDGFLETYFLDRRTVSSTILTELGEASKKAGLKPREHAFAYEPVDGSDTLSMLTIAANFEGSYSDLIEFVNLVDRSSRFLIIENLQAAPTQQAGVLSMRFKINAFVREEAREEAGTL